eukprot:Hpha_TRINITY_DN31088_c0_g1::TRINITY_DN31088_c0_g1_i1::g.63921::m.63921
MTYPALAAVSRRPRSRLRVRLSRVDGGILGLHGGIVISAARSRGWGRGVPSPPFWRPPRTVPPSPARALPVFVLSAHPPQRACPPPTPPFPLPTPPQYQAACSSSRGELGGHHGPPAPDRPPPPHPQSWCPAQIPPPCLPRKRRRSGRRRQWRRLLYPLFPSHKKPRRLRKFSHPPRRQRGMGRDGARGRRRTRLRIPGAAAESCGPHPCPAAPRQRNGRSHPPRAQSGHHHLQRVERGRQRILCGPPPWRSPHLNPLPMSPPLTLSPRTQPLALQPMTPLRTPRPRPPPTRPLLQLKRGRRIIRVGLTSRLALFENISDFRLTGWVRVMRFLSLI